MSEDMGVAATPPGSCPSDGAASSGVSTVPASIPNAGMFGVLAGYGFEVVTITRVSEQCFWYTGHHSRGSRETRAYHEKLICWTPDRAAAERASQRLVSAEAERERRSRAARVWFEAEKDKIAASATSAGTAETAQQAQGQRPASAVPERQTPNA